MRPGPLLSTPAILLLTGCDIAAMQPRGEGADSIAHLIWIFTLVSAAIWLLVVAALLIALARRRRTTHVGLLTKPGSGEMLATRIVSVCVGLTGIIIAALTLLSYMTGKS